MLYNNTYEKLVIIESQDELAVIKERVTAGETIYTVVDNKVVFLSYDELEQAVVKKTISRTELSNLFEYFVSAEMLTDDTTENANKTPVTNNNNADEQESEPNESEPCVANVQGISDKLIENLDWKNYIEERLDLIEVYLENQKPFNPHIKKTKSKKGESV